MMASCERSLEAPPRRRAPRRANRRPRGATTVRAPPSTSGLAPASEGPCPRRDTYPLVGPVRLGPRGAHDHKRRGPGPCGQVLRTLATVILPSGHTWTPTSTTVGPAGREVSPNSPLTLWGPYLYREFTTTPQASPCRAPTHLRRGDTEVDAAP